MSPLLSSVDDLFDKSRQLYLSYTPRPTEAEWFSGAPKCFGVVFVSDNERRTDVRDLFVAFSREGETHTPLVSAGRAGFAMGSFETGVEVYGVADAQPLATEPTPTAEERSLLDRFASKYSWLTSTQFTGSARIVRLCPTFLRIVRIQEAAVYETTLLRDSDGWRVIRERRKA